jgi:hypothetical protein
MFTLTVKLHKITLIKVEFKLVLKSFLNKVENIFFFINIKLFSFFCLENNFKNKYLYHAHLKNKIKIINYIKKSLVLN